MQTWQTNWAVASSGSDKQNVQRFRNIVLCSAAPYESFWEQLEAAIALMQPVSDAIHQLEGE